MRVQQARVVTIGNITSRKPSETPLRSLVRPLLFTATLAAALAANGTDTLAPNANLKADGLPPIPADLVAKVAPYTEFRPATAIGWHPLNRELIVARRAGNTTQLHRVAEPGAALMQLTDFAEPVRFGGWWPKAPNVLMFTRDAGGNEQRQIYRLDPGASEPVLLTDAVRKNELAGVTHARDRMLVDSTDVDKAGRHEDPTTDLTLVDPLEQAGPRKVATLPGTGWGDFSFSFDDRRLALVESRSVNESYVWVMDVTTGARRRVLPAGNDPADKTIASGDVSFSRDGKGLFLST